MIRYVTTTHPVRINFWCVAALHHRIHLRGDSLMREWMAKRDTVDVLSIAIDNETPVGVAVMCKSWSWGMVSDEKLGRVNFGVYVRYNYRRQGIGRELISRVTNRTDQQTKVGRWNRTATSFFNSVGA